MRPAILGAIAGGGSAAVDSDLAAWLAAVAADTGTVSAGTQTAMSTFIVGAKADSIWSKLLRVSLPCGDFAASKVPQKATVGASRDTFTNIVSGDYAENLGVSTDGSTKYIASGYTPSEAVGGLAFYLRTAQTSNTTGRFMGGSQNAGATQNFSIRGNRSSLNGSSSGTVSAAWGGGSAASNCARAGGVSVGLWHIVRRGTTDAELYLNGVSVATSATSITPATPSGQLLWMCLNSGGTPALFLEASTYTGGMFVTDAMNGTEALAFYNRVQAFQTALSRNV